MNRPPWILGLITVAFSTMLIASGCADRSYAPDASQDVEAWRVPLLIAGAVSIVVWVVALAVGTRGGAGSIAAGIAQQIATSVLIFTALGQLGDWVMRAIHGWAVVGTVLLVIGSGVMGLQGLGGVPIPYVLLFGWVYPRPELLPLVTIPALVVQAIMIPVSLVLAARSGRY